MPSVRALLHANIYEGLGTWLYERFAPPAMIEHYRRLSARLAGELRPGAWVLDLGCGPGDVLLRLAQARSDLHLVGIDVARSAVRRCRVRARQLGLRNLHVLHAPAQRLPFTQPLFDVVVSTGVLKHWPLPAAVVAEAGRVLRQDGRLLLFELDPQAGDERFARVGGRHRTMVCRVMKRWVLPLSTSRDRARRSLEGGPLRLLGDCTTPGLPLYEFMLAK